MRGLSESEFHAKMDKIRQENVFRDRKRQLREERAKGKTHRKLPSTSKLILICMMVLCVEIVLFTEYLLIISDDASSAYALIGIPAALAPVVWGYYSKAKAENVVGGITYESAMRDSQETQNTEMDEDDPEGGDVAC